MAAQLITDAKVVVGINLGKSCEIKYMYRLPNKCDF